MKKVLYFAVALFGAVMFTACNKDSQTPEGDKTKLWPAGEDGSEQLGFINKKGEMEIKVNYDNACSFSCGWACVQEGKDISFIDKKGKARSIDSEEFCEEYFYYNTLRFRDGKLYGMWDNDFNVIIRPDYYSLGRCGDNGLIAFCEEENDKVGYMNKSEEIEILPEWDGASPFKDGIATVYNRKKTDDGTVTRYAVIDASGDYLVDMQKYALSNMGEGRIRLCKASSEKTKYYMCDKYLEEISGAYDYMSAFSCGLAMVEKLSGDYYKSGFINKKGELIIECRYHDAWNFEDDVTWVKKNSDSNWELIDKKGEQVLKLKSDESPYSGFHNGLALVVKSDEGSVVYRYIDKKGETVYKWNPGEDEDDDDDDDWAPRKMDDLRMKSILRTEAGVLFLEMKEAEAIQ